VQDLIRIFLAFTTLLGVVVTVWGSYHVVIALMSLRRFKQFPQAAPKHRFAVMIAARNESAVIGALVESLKQQDYPDELYDIVVIPNNCTDDTAGVAQRAGARVLECTVPVKVKGDALRFAVSRLMGEDYDAFCVFDADNVVDSQFLREMNNALCAGARAAQGYRGCKNPYDTAISGCYAIYSWMFNRFYNQGKAACGLSTMASGTGFMVSRSVLKELGGWNTRTISEDLEITVQCALHDTPIAWVPTAISYDEQPLTFKESVKQRKRWSSGTIQVSQRYLPRVVNRMRRAPKSSWLDILVTLTIPNYQAAAALSMLLSFFAAGFVGGIGRFVLLACLGTTVVNLLMTALMSTASGLLVTALEGQLSPKLWKGFLAYGLFLLSWMPITLYCMSHRTVEWEEIRHTRNIAQIPVRQTKGALRQGG